MDADKVKTITAAASQPVEWQWVEAESHESVHRDGADARLKWLLPKLGIARP